MHLSAGCKQSPTLVKKENDHGYINDDKISLLGMRHFAGFKSKAMSAYSGREQSRHCGSGEVGGCSIILINRYKSIVQARLCR